MICQDHVVRPHLQMSASVQVASHFQLFSGERYMLLMICRRYWDVRVLLRSLTLGVCLEQAAAMEMIESVSDFFVSIVPPGLVGEGWTCLAGASICCLSGSACRP